MRNSDIVRRDPDQPASGKEVGSATEPCPLSSKQNNEPAKVNKSIDTVTVTCTHGRKCPPGALFELVPTAGTSLPYTDRTTVVWTGPNIPPSIEVTEFGKIKGGGTYVIPFNFEREKEEKEWRANVGKSLKGSISGNGAQVAAGLAMTAGLTLVELMSEMWTYKQYKSYSISGLPTGSLDVRTYNPERWTLKIKFPKLKSFKGGVSLDKELKTDKMILSTSSSSSVQNSGNYSPNLGKNTYTDTSAKTEISVAKTGNVTTIEAKQEKKDKESSATTGDYITISRNGSALKFDALNSISALLKLVENIYNIVELIKEVNAAVPKAGISFDFSVQVMDGDFSVEWAWMEYSDYQAYYNIKPAIVIKLLSGTVRISFGISMPGFKAQGYISGRVDTPLTLQFENTKPGETWYANIKSQGKISVVLSLTVGVDIELGYFLHINPLVTAGISLEGGVKGDPDFSIKATIGFTGLVAKLVTSVAVGGGYGTKKKYEAVNSGGSIYGDTNSDPGTKVLIQACDWGEWKFPDKTDPNADVDESGFATIIGDMLSGKTNHTNPLEFLREKDASEQHWDTSSYEELSVPQIALRIAQKATGKPLRRTANALKALANEIRTELDVIYYKGFFRDNFVSLDELDKFIDGGQLDGIFSNNQDPTKLI